MAENLNSGPSRSGSSTRSLKRIEPPISVCKGEASEVGVWRAGRKPAPVSAPPSHGSPLSRKARPKSAIIPGDRLQTEASLLFVPPLCASISGIQHPWIRCSGDPFDLDRAASSGYRNVSMFATKKKCSYCFKLIS